MLSNLRAWLRRAAGIAVDRAFRAVGMYPAQEVGYPPREAAHGFWRGSRAGSRVDRTVTVSGDIYAFCLTIGPVSFNIESAAEHEWLTGSGTAGKEAGR